MTEPNQSVGNYPDLGDDSSALNETVYARLQSMMPTASVKEVFEVCIEDVRKRISDMSECLKVGELDRLRQAAHKIKGGSSMIGAARLSRIAAQIEMGSDQVGKVREWVEELSSACDELERILRKRNAGKGLVITE